MSSNNYFYINSDYGYNKRDFTLIEKIETEYKNVNEIKENKKNYDCVKHQNHINNKKKINNVTNNNMPTNNFPLSWTCYESNNKWICPMRGDK
jgi:hypothetical protein